jgi:hypothetical protein
VVVAVMDMRPDTTDKTIAIPAPATENLAQGPPPERSGRRDMEQETVHSVVGDEIVVLVGVPVLRCAADGPQLNGERAALDLVGEALGRAELVAVPVARIAPAFFDLSSTAAGEIVQKFVTYRLRLAVVGDVTEHVAASTALRDFVRECNRGTQTWFVADEAELAARLGA